MEEVFAVEANLELPEEIVDSLNDEAYQKECTIDELVGDIIKRYYREGLTYVEYVEYGLSQNIRNNSKIS